MSGYAGELFVRIVPDAQGFDKSLENQVSRQTNKTGSNTGIGKLQADQRLAQNELAKTAKAAELASAQFLLGAGSEEEQAAAAQKFTVAARAAAEANLQLAVATGEGIGAATQQVAALRASDVALDEHTRHAQRFRQQARLVAEGEAPLSSLFGPASLLRFGAGALAFGAIVTTLGEVEKSLKVTGDEAFTTEGRFRNLGSALLTGNVIEAFHAVNDQAASFSVRLKNLRGDTAATATDFQQLGYEAGRAAEQTQKDVDVLNALGDNSGAANKIREISAETVRAAEAADALARAYRTSVYAVEDVEAAIRRAGSAQAQYGERGTAFGSGPGGIASERPRGTTTPVDATNTLQNRNAIREANARGDKQLLAVLRDEQAQARKDLDGLKRGEQGYEQALLEYAQARARADAVAQQIADDEARRAAAAAAKAEQAARERAAAAKRRKEELVREAKQVSDTADTISSAFNKIGERFNKGKSKTATASGGSFTLGDLYQSAVDQFSTFGSNIAGRNGVLSAQDERGAFASAILRNLGSRGSDPVQVAQLAVQTTTNVILAQIRDRIGGTTTPASHRSRPGTLGAGSAEAAMRYQYGIS